MGCLDSATRAAIAAEIVLINTQIAAANTALTASLTNSEIESYKFGSGAGEGMQSADRRSPKEINEVIDELESRRNRLQRKLDGTLNVTMAFRRRSGCNGSRYR